MRALVTGAAGFVGSSLSERLLQDGHQVTGIDSFTECYPVWIKRHNLTAALANPGYRFVEGDLLTLDLAALLDRVDWVFHQAAQAGVRASWGASFEVYTRDNVLTTQRLLEAAKGRPLRKFVYASSSSVYGDAEQFPTPETAVPQPLSPYGVTKLAAEHLCYLYWRSYGVPTVSLRYFTVYGPRQRPDMAFHIFARALLEGKPITVYGDGLQSRDFTFISDALQANLLAAEHGEPGSVFNIGGGSRVTLRDTIAALERCTGVAANLAVREAQRGDARHTSADTARARAALGYAPTIDLETGLAAEVAWVRELLSAKPSLP